MRRNLYVGATFVAILVALGVATSVLDRRAAVEAAAVMAPRFEVNPLWPKPLPNHWILGQTIGVSVDAQDHIWIIHRGGSLEPGEVHATTKPPIAQCCAPAPPVLEFNEDGDLIGHWGGPGQGYDWPDRNHGITVDYKGNVWIGGNGVGQQPNAPRGKASGAAKAAAEEGQVAGIRGYFNDSFVVKFTQSGKFLMQIGKPGQSKGSNDVENLRLPAKTFVDKATNEVYVADGYGNHRVIVYDADTGKYKRHWGAYGHKPEDVDLGPYNPSAPPAQQFRNPVHCVRIARDGMVYVCDRVNDRFQVFRKDGSFVTEYVLEPTTRWVGSVWDIALSEDPEQKYLFVADGTNNEIHILLRKSGQELGSFGRQGRYAGEFHWVHAIAIDSHGNLFSGEVDTGKRIQKFTRQR